MAGCLTSPSLQTVQEPLISVKREAVNLPAEFITQMEAVLGVQGTASLCAHLQEPPTVAVRFHPRKTDEALRKRILEGFGVRSDNDSIHRSTPDTRSDLHDDRADSSQIAQLPYSTHSRLGYFLPQRPEFYLDPLLHAGCYYVQEASSMYLERIVPLLYDMRRQKPMQQTLRVLDLCASPGGKSTHLLSMLSESDNTLLISNEVIKSRTGALCENLAKWGFPNSVVTNNDPADFAALHEWFDVIVVDAPCSGEGMFRKDEAAVSEWSLDNVAICAARQKRILADIIPSLRPGGLLVYSTCTFNKSEDEDNATWICGQYPHFELIEQRHFYPGTDKAGEGFFMAILQDNREYTFDNAVAAATPASPGKSKRGNGSTARLPFKSSPAFVKDGYTFAMKGEFVKAYPADAYRDILAVESVLRVIQSGTIVASALENRKKGTVELIPEYSLIQSMAYRRGSLPETEADLPTALSYLRLDAITLPESAPLGHVVLTYQGIPFGLVKNIGRRCNNLLPNSLRIRKQ